MPRKVNVSRISAQLIKGLSAGNTVYMATQSRLPAFLLTRPMAQSQRFAAQLRHRFGPDLLITISPLIAPHFLAPAFPVGPFTALIFTSETGVAAFAQHPNRPNCLPIRAYCVGDQTAKAAQSAGLEPVSADGDAATLIALIQATHTGPLLHLCGTQTRGDVAQTLTDAGHPTTALELYDQREHPLTAAAIDLLRGERPLLVPLFSPRSATLFCQHLAIVAPTAPLTVIALSAAVATALPTTMDHHTAKKPTADAMIVALANLCDPPQVP
jgi:uroporphyrinogen-III synthase